MPVSVKVKSKKELPKSEEKEKLSEEKDIPKVEVSIIDSLDTRDRDKGEAENAQNKESMEHDDDSNKPVPKGRKIQLKYTYRESKYFGPSN